MLWRYSSEQGRRPWAPGAYILGADDTQEGSQLSVRKGGDQHPRARASPLLPSNEAHEARGARPDPLPVALPSQGTKQGGCQAYVPSTPRSLLCQGLASILRIMFIH